MLPPLNRDGVELVRRFAAEHEQMRDDLPSCVTPPNRWRRSARCRHGIVGQSRRFSATLLPNEEAEDGVLYPALAQPLGSLEATATMSPHARRNPAAGRTAA